MASVVTTVAAACAPLLARHWIHSEMKYIELQKAAFATYVYID